MKERLLSLLGGFILSLGIIIAAIFFFSRPAPVKVEDVKAIDPASLETIQDTTKSLTNNGDLPKTLSDPDVGRNNPFDDY